MRKVAQSRTLFSLVMVGVGPVGPGWAGSRQGGREGREQRRPSAELAQSAERSQLESGEGWGWVRRAATRQSEKPAKPLRRSVPSTCSPGARQPTPPSLVSCRRGRDEVVPVSVRVQCIDHDSQCGYPYARVGNTVHPDGVGTAVDASGRGVKGLAPNYPPRVSRLISPRPAPVPSGVRLSRGVGAVGPLSLSRQGVGPCGPRQCQIRWQLPVLLTPHRADAVRRLRSK